MHENPKKDQSRGLNHDKKGASAASDLSEGRVQVSCMDYRVVIEPNEDGDYVAVCPALLGCSTKGKSYAEALAKLEANMAKYLASLKQSDLPATLPVIAKSVEIRA